MSIFVSAIDGMTSHDAADVTRLETILIRQEGIVGVTANDLLVEAQGTPDMTVKVNPGSCFVLRDAHTDNSNTLKFWHVIVDTTTNVTIPAADASNPRIDLICVKIDSTATPNASASNVATLVNVQGTAAASPSAPVVPANHLKLAEVSVPALDTTISSGQITDSRVFMGLHLPYADGYRLKDTGGTVDAQIYEDSSGRVIIKSSKSGGELRIDPLTNRVEAKATTNDVLKPLSTGEAELVFIIDGGGSAITTGQKGHLEIPFDCTIQGWTIMSDQSGSIVVDVWKDTYANFPPTVADTIAGTEKPTLSTAQKNQDLSLTTWTTTLSKGDILAFNVDSITTVTRVTIILRVTKR